MNGSKRACQWLPVFKSAWHGCYFDDWLLSGFYPERRMRCEDQLSNSGMNTSIHFCCHSPTPLLHLPAIILDRCVKTQHVLPRHGPWWGFMDTNNRGNEITAVSSFFFEYVTHSNKQCAGFVYFSNLGDQDGMTSVLVWSPELFQCATGGHIQAIIAW